MKPRIFLAAFAAIGMATAGSVAAQASGCKLIKIDEWPLRSDYYRPAVDGEINGQKVGILLDTGAGRSMLRRSAALRLGLILHETGSRRAYGVGGETSVDVVELEKVRIGSAVRTNWRVPVAGEHDFGDDVGFILGDDFFHQVDLEFDLANNAVRLFQPKDCEGVGLVYWTREAAGEVPMERGTKIWLSVSLNGKPVRAALDSGASSTVLALPDAALLGVTPHTSGVVAGGCLFGMGRQAIDSWIATFDTFAIGHELIRNPKIRIANLWRYTTSTETGSRLPSQHAGLPPMLLGADFLRAHRVLVAHSQRKLYFTYAGGTVFPGRMSRGCNEPSAASPRGDPLPQKGQR